MNQRFLIPLFFALPAWLPAQSCGFSEGKNLVQLRTAVFEKEQSPVSRYFFTDIHRFPQLGNASTLPPLFLLPKWSAAELPFFCKIEHDWGKKSGLPFKFRLGSVEYVDWLEGK